MEFRARVMGCLLGGLVGDAFGTPYEGTRPPINATWDRKYWSISDDSQLTAATCRAIVDAGGAPQPERIAAVFADWFRRGRFRGVGASTLKALRDLSAGAHWALAGAKGENAGGNGAAMRIAPVAFLVDPQSTAGRRSIRDISRITHHHEEAYVGALAIATAIHAVLTGAWTGGPGLLNYLASVLPDSRVADRIVHFRDLQLESALTDFAPDGVSGFAADSVPVAILIAERHSTSFRDALSCAVSLGGDTDTVASMTGQILGTLLGEENLRNAIPFKQDIDPEVLRALEDYAHQKTFVRR